MAITYADEYLNYWGDVYVEKSLIEYGIVFEMFLRMPKAILNAIEQHNFKPLLPRQRQVAAQIRHDEAMAELQKHEETRLEALNAVRRNSGYVEPMHHHRHPRSKPRFMQEKIA